MQRVACLVVVQASSLAMSIIIIGIGNAEFDGNSDQLLFLQQISLYHWLIGFILIEEHCFLGAVFIVRW